jgi:16S rRNA (guanine527-N7)-methyltransferase
MSADDASTRPEPQPFGAEDFAQATGATAEQVAALGHFSARLADANLRMNLVGPSAIAEFWRRHAFDSAQLLQVEPQARVWADLGAGAGLPGVVLAILLKGAPGARVHLVESMAKRCAFLREVIAACELPAEVHHLRAEDWRPPKDLQVVTARACAPLPRLLDFAWPAFKVRARGVFLKGRDVEQELTEARRRWRFEADLIPSLSDPSGRIVRIERLARA